MRFYLVGGAVRDKQLGLPIIDRDYLVVGGTPDILLQQGFQQVGKGFPVFLHPETKEEYALARTEKKTGKGYTGFICHFSPEVSLEEDLFRRDLTINAMAEDENGTIYDFYGGRQDLAHRLLRHVSPAFTEDPLRVLRLARFFARFSPLGFTIAPETLALMQKMTKAGELQNLTAERIWQETEKALNTSCPQAYFDVLEKVGALEILFPEWQHYLSTQTHTLPALQCQLDRLLHAPIFEGAFPHIPTPNKEKQGVFCFIAMFSRLPTKDITSLCHRLKVPQQWKTLTLSYQRFRQMLLQAFELEATSVLALFEQLDIYRQPNVFLTLCVLLRADKNYQGQDVFLWQLYQTTLTINVQSIIQAGFEKQGIRQELYRRRLQKITENLSQKSGHQCEPCCTGENE